MRFVISVLDGGLLIAALTLALAVLTREHYPLVPIGLSLLGQPAASAPRNALDRAQDWLWTEYPGSVLFEFDKHSILVVGHARRADPEGLAASCAEVRRAVSEAAPSKRVSVVWQIPGGGQHLCPKMAPPGIRAKYLDELLGGVPLPWEVKAG